LRRVTEHVVERRRGDIPVMVISGGRCRLFHPLADGAIGAESLEPGPPAREDAVTGPGLSRH
jgi:hypothetical protein